MKYHALLTANPGINVPPTNLCKLLNFSFLKLGANETYSAESGEREFLAVVLGGKASFEINDKRFEKSAGDPMFFLANRILFISLQEQNLLSRPAVTEAPIRLTNTRWITCRAKLTTKKCFFNVNPGDGFGICHYYNEEGEEENFTVRDNSIHMMPRGYHTVVSAPGYTTYYLWFLAGNQRVQATLDDPTLGWVSRTVAMLKELGH